MLNSSYVTIFLWPLAAILDFRQKNTLRSRETWGVLTGH